jgi:hypothetical protein
MSHMGSDCDFARPAKHARSYRMTGHRGWGLDFADRITEGMEARRVKTRLKPGFQRQPTARSRRETANHWAADQQSRSMNLLCPCEAIRFCVPMNIRMRTSATSVVTAVVPPSHARLTLTRRPRASVSARHRF